jgi:hypothetical protein
VISKGIAAEKPANTWDVAVVLDVSSVSQNTLSELFESFDGKCRMWVSQGISRHLSTKMELLSAGEFEPGTTLTAQSLWDLDLSQSENTSIKLARLG